MHATNSIIIQRTSAATNQPTLLAVSTTKRRSFQSVYRALEPYIKKRKRKHPDLLPNIETSVNNLDGFLLSIEELTWLFLKFESARKGIQSLPGWKGLFHLGSSQPSGLQTVGYLPSIDKSPTHHDTAQEILVQCMEKTEALGLNKTDLVLDHAIYAKAKIIMDGNNENLKSFINIHMGGFHTACIFLGVIGKKFGDAGPKDLIVECDLLGENSTSQLLKGKFFLLDFGHNAAHFFNSILRSLLSGRHYNNAMQIHMNVCKALMRLKFEGFLSWLDRTENFEVYKQLMEAEEVTRINTNVNRETFQQVTRKFKRIIDLVDQFHKLTSNKEEWIHFGILTLKWSKHFVTSVKP